MRRKKRLRAIDLYSGVGGWSLGLGLAGIEVVASYERWDAANTTNFRNNGHKTHTVDIRKLSFTDLPHDIDVVVGSPPCVEFSYSNRGGTGNLDDGLEDIATFLRIVDYLKPKQWVMENVPRVAGIIEKEMAPRGRLRQFAHLEFKPHIINMEEFGVPQRRKRCVAGNFNFELLRSYSRGLQPMTLGDVVTALAGSSVVDPIYGLTLSRREVIDHEAEQSLNAEETRINRANKTTHPVYNSMPFPDRMDRPVRTLTATCTRVARESIVIDAPEKPGFFRRLTIRERATLQGFPINFQFYGINHRQKERMIGNAVPPAFAYLIGHSLIRTPSDALPPLHKHVTKICGPTCPPKKTSPDRPGASYPSNRRFRFAIPSLRLKSGVRFELCNKFEAVTASWSVDFYFGNSKQIVSIDLDSFLLKKMLPFVAATSRNGGAPILNQLRAWIIDADIENMQSSWANRYPGRTRPFMLLDELDFAGEKLTRILSQHPDLALEIIESALEMSYPNPSNWPKGIAKLKRNAPQIAAGFIIGTLVNNWLEALLLGRENGVRPRSHTTQENSFFSALC